MSFNSVSGSSLRKDDRKYKNKYLRRKGKGKTEEEPEKHENY